MSTLMVTSLPMKTKQPAKQATRLVGYIRVSSVEQASEGVSLAAQRAKLQAYATAMDLELVDIAEDAGVSAKSLRRPGLQRALAMLDDGEADGLLVAKLDRLTRSVRDLAELIDGYFGEAAGKSLLSVGDSIDTRSAAGRLVLNVLTSVGQWEREATGERTREALRHLQRRGVRLGGEAYGWNRLKDQTDAEGRRVFALNVEEARIVERIVELRRQGLVLRAIANQLTKEGYVTKRGGVWSSKTVLFILRRESAA